MSSSYISPKFIGGNSTNDYKDNDKLNLSNS